MCLSQGSGGSVLGKGISITGDGGELAREAEGAVGDASEWMSGCGIGLFFHEFGIGDVGGLEGGLAAACVALMLGGGGAVDAEDVEVPVFDGPVDDGDEGVSVSLLLCPGELFVVMAETDVDVHVELVDGLLMCGVLLLGGDGIGAVAVDVFFEGRLAYDSHGGDGG